jgi:hypothetical protein
VASSTKQSERRRAKRHANMGRRRKAKESKHSTPSMAELFAGFGEPGKPVPKQAKR